MTVTTIIVTAYCHCALCCGTAGQPTASGAQPRAGITVAAPRSVPFGSVVVLPGIGRRVVQDRLARRYDNRIDVFVPTHQEAVRFGKRKMRVKIEKAKR